MTGSTAGGLKIARFMVAFRSSWMEIRNLLTGKNKASFRIDGIFYAHPQISIILTTIMVYFLLFFSCGIAIMITSSTVTFTDGSTQNIDFVPAFTASIANLGNIGPAVAIGTVNAGPTGNYYAYSETAKIIMIVLMFVGRIGVLSFLMLFVTSSGQQKLKAIEYSDADTLVLMR
jgi:trk system potassium uptake protein TrkH